MHKAMRLPMLQDSQKGLWKVSTILRTESCFRNNGQKSMLQYRIPAGIKNGFMTYTNDEILSCQPVI
ncbi:hypothetical protein CEK25_007663 [Fusarium fujikuroi]|nr:hypothetical protein CEK25_007663 [Fusarium fujikuroi]